MNIFKKVALAATMVCGLGFLTTSAEAQSRIVVRQNGKVVIVVTVPRQERCQPHQQPHRHQSRQERRQERQERRERRRQSGRHYNVVPRRPAGYYDPIIHVWRPYRCNPRHN